MTSVPKNVYNDNLAADVKSCTYIDINKQNNSKGPKFEVGDHVRISKLKNIFAEDYTPNWSEKVFVIKRVKNTVPRTFVIGDLNGEENFGTIYKKEWQKTNQKQFRIEKALKENARNYMLNGKATIILLKVGLIKNT